MITQAHTYSPSTNIIRDVETPFDYIVTSNSDQIFNSLISGYLQDAKRSLNIIGSYGTGKSSFLLALRHSLTKKHNYFNRYESELKALPTFAFIPVVGEYESIISAFSTTFSFENKSNDSKGLIKHIEGYYNNLAKDGKGLAIVVDEFGKFLEYVIKHNPEKELYFLQQLAELANDSSKNILFITALHQGFDAYAFELDKVKKNEWTKVGGRFKDLPFNEPVEQLLLLASNRLNDRKYKLPKGFKDLFELISQSKTFPLNDYFSLEMAEKLYPFDMLSAAILTLSLQKYGQNERSLFSFLEGQEYLNINDFDHTQKTYYNLGLVYDYLIYHFHSLIVSRHNEYHHQWTAIRSGLERVEGIYEDINTVEIAQYIVKIIGLLNIFASSSATINSTFLINYVHYTLKVPKKRVKDILGELEKKHKVIIYRRHLFRYYLTEGSDVDLDQELAKAEALIQEVSNIVGKLNEHFSFPYVLARSYYFETGTPRFFKFMLTDALQQPIPEGEIDGYINLVVSDNTTDKEIILTSKKNKEAVLYGHYKNIEDIKHWLLEIEKIKSVHNAHKEDKILVRELNDLEQHYKQKLEESILSGLYGNNEHLDWYFGGEKLTIKNRRGFNKNISKICAQVYSSTPKVHFEMVNKTKLSGAMQNARKKLIRAMVENPNESNLGFPDKKFPPEKSIYMTLLQQTGIHSVQNHVGIFQKPNEESLIELWDVCEKFLDSTKPSKRRISDLVETLSSKPFKLKKGLIDYWLPIFLYIKKDEYALFGVHGFVPNISAENLELIVKNPDKYFIKAFDLDNIKLSIFNSYRELLQQETELKPKTNTFIEAIKPFLSFYQDLPYYSRQTNKISKKAKLLRKAIENAKDFEKTFFEDFPQALGYTLLDIERDKEKLKLYIKELKQVIRELREAFDTLIGRFEQSLMSYLGITSSTPFTEYKPAIEDRYKTLKTHLLLHKQKIFSQRLRASMDNSKEWLLSLAQTCLGKKLSQISDKEVPLLFDNLESLLYELDKLNNVRLQDIDTDKEYAFELSITSFTGKLTTASKLIRLSKDNKEMLEKQEQSIRDVLKSGDRKLNIAILAKLLQNELNDEQQE